MERYASHKLAMNGVLVLILLLMVLLIVPTTTAGDSTGINQVGNVNIDGSGLHKCWMFDPETETLAFIDDDPQIVASRIDEYPDTNALMRCEFLIPDYNGEVYWISINSFSPSTVSCRVELDPESGTKGKVTDYWHQTISSSGNVQMICRFRR